MNNLKYDFHKLKTGIILVFFIITTGFYFSQNVNLSDMIAETESNIEILSSLKNKINQNKNKLKKFQDELSSRNLLFISSRTDFGIYKFMEELDKYRKYYNFKYTIDEKPKSVSKDFEYYVVEYTINYENSIKTKKLINILTNKYYNNFIDGSYAKGKLKIKYYYYGVKK